MGGSIDFSSFSILIIDDNEFVRFMIEKHLAGFGCREIYQAPDGLVGFNVLQEKRPELVICDINMAPVNGFEFLKKVRSMNSSIASVPIVFLTSNADESFVQKAINFEIDAYLLKPVMPSLLRSYLSSIMEKKMMA